MPNRFMLLYSTARREFGLWRAQFRKPVVTHPTGELAPGDAPCTFVSVVSPVYRQSVPHASVLARQGWCHGFEELGIPYVILGTHELADRLPALPNPICLLHNQEYLFLNRRNLQALRRVHHFVWLDYWFRNDAAFFHRHGFDYQSLALRTHRAILHTEPAFGYTIAPATSFGFYQNWLDRGLALLSLPLACDRKLYHPDVPHHPAFDDVQIAFVGGYWPYKAMQFDRYLRPYEDQLTVFGRERWPYAGYGGQLSLEEEPALYRQARLAPAINEPHCEAFNLDQNERVFKVLGSGGCSITDAIPGYREWFTQDELAVPGTLAEFHEMVDALLHDDALNRRYRDHGLAAIRERHTYAHRARTVLDQLGLHEVGRRPQSSAAPAPSREQTG